MDVFIVGKKGYVLGLDSDWDYLYFGKMGLIIFVLGWVRFYMYDSRGINIYDFVDLIELKVCCAVFNWLRVGWFGINMVKKKYIYRGFKCFVDIFKEIVESLLLFFVDRLICEFL